jgi:hypothetical protein
MKSDGQIKEALSRTEEAGTLYLDAHLKAIKSKQRLMR